MDVVEGEAADAGMTGSLVLVGQGGNGKMQCQLRETHGLPVSGKSHMVHVQVSQSGVRTGGAGH